MAVIFDPTGQFQTNRIVSVSKAFGDVPAAFGTLIALGDDFIYEHFMIINSLDAGITIQFNSTDTDTEIPFPANKDIVMDGFKNYGTLKYKYTSGAPTTGSLQIICY